MLGQKHDFHDMVEFESIILDYSNKIKPDNIGMLILIKLIVTDNVI